MYNFAQITTPKSICNTLVIRTYYLLHQTLSIYLITRNKFSAVRIMKLRIVQTPNVLLYVAHLKENWRIIFGIILHFFKYYIFPLFY